MTLRVALALVAAIALFAGAGSAHARDARRVLHAGPDDYLARARTLEPGDTLVLAPGDYDAAGEVSGLPVFDLHGTESAPITISGPERGPQPVLLGRRNQNVVRIANASHVVIRNLVIDGRNLGGDGVNGQGMSHHITLENLTIRGVGGNQQVVGISTNRAPTWNWTIRGNVIRGAGTGMYLGNSDGRNPFVAGLIERNLVVDSIGYNVQIKHQARWPELPGMPSGKTATVIRHNVFAKGDNSATGPLARPNLLVGDVPPDGRGSDNHYEIYGNFFHRNPTEALFQGEGSIAFYANVLVNDSGPAVAIQPHNGRVREVHVFGNTIVATGTGISIRSADAREVRRADVNAVFASEPIVAANQLGNVVGPVAAASRHLANPLAPPGKFDAHPKSRALRGPLIDAREWTTFTDWDRDFDGEPRNWRVRGAYVREAGKRSWLPRIERKPCARHDRACTWG